VTLYLSQLPLWAATLLLVVLPTLITMAITVALRRLVGHENLASNNEIAGFKFAVVGVIYAVLLAFAVIVVWEKFSDAEYAVVEEAGASATLYRLTAGPDPDMVGMRQALTNYLGLVLSHDWPEMAQEHESPEVTHALDGLYAAALVVSKDDAKHPAIAGQIFTQLNTITQDRRTRLHLATGIVPNIIWGVLYGGAFLTVGFTFFFGTKSWKAQLLMSAILTVLVFSGLLVIVSIDHPFTGPTHVDDEPIKMVFHDFGQP
jgi:hypothetical protein